MNEMQSMNEIHPVFLTEKLDESEFTAPSTTIKRMRDPQPKSKKSFIKLKRSESEKKRCNDRKQTVEGCYFCGKSFRHTGICPAQGHECHRMNHTENVCQQKKRELKRNLLKQANQTAVEDLAK